MTIRPLKRMEEFAEIHGYQDFLEHRRKRFQSMEVEMNSDIQQKSLVQLLLQENSPESDRNNSSGYVEDVRFGPGTDRPGVDVLVEWSRRNMLIFQNLYRMTQGCIGERILVVYGSGHGYILRDLVRSAPDFELIDATDFLRAGGC